MALVRRALASLLALAALVSPGRAKAAEAQRAVYTINPGAFGAFHSHRGEVGFGFELSVLRLFESKSGDGGWYGLGGVAQIADMRARDDEGKVTGDAFVRTMLGVEATWTGVGVELGWAYVGRNDVESATHAVHLAPFLSLGIFYASFPLTVPFAHASGTGHPTDVGAIVGLKVPLLLRDGELGTFLDFFGDAKRPPPPPPRGPNDPN